MRTAADEMRAPKYAHVERERRWLVRPDAAPEADATRCLLIEDRYIDGTRLRLRRMTDVATGERQSKISKKYETDDALARPIVTAYLTDAEHAVFAALPAREVTKRRHTVRASEQDFSVDRFEGALAGLGLAEIEQPDADSLRATPPPPWAAREVSDNPDFQGGALARDGIPKE